MRILTTALALAAALSITKGSNAFAGELDNEASVTNQAVAARDLPATLIVRVDKKTKAVQVMHLSTRVPLKGLNKAAVAASPLFKSMGLNQKMAANGELDHDSSSSSWYFGFRRGGFGGWGYPSYYYGGYAYNNFYNYGGYDYGGCSYSYYSNPYYGFGGYGGSYGGWGGYGGGWYGGGCGGGYGCY